MTEEIAIINDKLARIKENTQIGLNDYDYRSILSELKLISGNIKSLQYVATDEKDVAELKELLKKVQDCNFTINKYRAITKEQKTSYTAKPKTSNQDQPWR